MQPSPFASVSVLTSVTLFRKRMITGMIFICIDHTKLPAVALRKQFDHDFFFASVFSSNPRNLDSEIAHQLLSFPQFYKFYNISYGWIYLNAFLFMSENELRFEIEVLTDPSYSSLIRDLDKIRSSRLERHAQWVSYFSHFPLSSMENVRKEVHAHQFPSRRSCRMSLDHAPLGQ